MNTILENQTDIIFREVASSVSTAFRSQELEAVDRTYRRIENEMNLQGINIVARDGKILYSNVDSSASSDRNVAVNPNTRIGKRYDNQKLIRTYLVDGLERSHDQNELYVEFLVGDGNAMQELSQNYKYTQVLGYAFMFGLSLSLSFIIYFFITKRLGLITRMIVNRDFSSVVENRKELYFDDITILQKNLASNYKLLESQSKELISGKLIYKSLSEVYKIFAHPNNLKELLAVLNDFKRQNEFIDGIQLYKWDKKKSDLITIDGITLNFSEYDEDRSFERAEKGIKIWRRRNDNSKYIDLFFETNVGGNSIGGIRYRVARTPFVIENLDLIYRLGITSTAACGKVHNIEYLAHYDSLTGLPNRHSFELELKECVSSQSLVKNAAILLIDLDDFKEINDTFGHDVGDALLKDVSKRISSHLREDYFLSRFGGDEFVIILPDIGASKLETTNICLEFWERLVTSTRQPFTYQDTERTIDMSGGIAFFPQDGTTGGELLKKAELSLYDAKKAGKSKLRFFHAQLEESMAKRHSIKQKLKEALRDGDFQVYLQPKVRLSDGLIIGAEALLRWFDSERGFISPVEFIPIAEENDSIVLLGNFVITQILEKIQSLVEVVEHVSINVSVRQFEKRDFIEQILKLTRDYKPFRRNLKFELTENILIDTDQDSNMEKLSILTDKGFEFSLDDFGTGYSSLSYLPKLHINELKIDRSFILELHNNKRNRTVVEAIIAMGKKLGMQIVAEGVELDTDIELLDSMGCDIYQGYFCSKPIPIEEFLVFANKWNEKVSASQPKFNAKRE